MTIIEKINFRSDFSGRFFYALGLVPASVRLIADGKPRAFLIEEIVVEKIYEKNQTAR